MLQAQIYLQADSPAVALPYVLSSLTESENYRLDNLHAAATVMLGELHLAMGFPHKALQALEGIMPHILQHCPLALHAQTFLLQAKCALADAQESTGSLPLPPPKKTICIFSNLPSSGFDTVLSLLEKAFA